MKTICFAGVDLSGNPFTQLDSEYYNILQYARDSGLKLALHVGEVDGLALESERLLQIPPGRIGHGTYLHANENLREVVIQNRCKGIHEWFEKYCSIQTHKCLFFHLLRIPLEICLTSNVITQTARNYKEHHLHKWIDINHPVLISTDDKGVFGTSLSNEYRIAADVLGIQQRAIYDLSEKAIDHIFADDNTKRRLHQDWALWLRNSQLND